MVNGTSTLLQMVGLIPLSSMRMRAMLRAAEDRLLMGRPVGLGLAYAPPIEVRAPSL